MKVAPRVLLILALMAVLSACNDDSPVVGASYWTFAYSPNMPLRMAGDAFDFPPKDGVHYVIKQAPPGRAGQTVTLRFAITGDGKLVPTQGEPPARVRLFLQKRGDTMTAAEEYKRWWSANSVELVPGEFTLKAQLTPGQWSSVFGKNGAEAPSEFQAATSDLGNVGFTFGGMFAGHGVYVTGGSAHFVLMQFSIL